LQSRPDLGGGSTDVTQPHDSVEAQLRRPEGRLNEARPQGGASGELAGESPEEGGFLPGTDPAAEHPVRQHRPQGNQDEKEERLGQRHHDDDEQTDRQAREETHNTQGNDQHS
jgi:hypothetical protein